MLNRLARVGVITACAVALAGLLGGTAYAQETFDPQPYVVYTVPPDSGIPSVVNLEDQFIDEQNVPVEIREFLMNPATKDIVTPPGPTEEITDPDLHYRWFPIPLVPSGATYTVWVSNKFAPDVEWTIADMPQFLLAPASKAEDPDIAGDPPTTGHHYTCYAVVPTGEPPTVPSANATVTLTDQFADRSDVDVGDARYLCAPVEKERVTPPPTDTYPTLSTPALHDHLACYDIPALPHTVTVNTNDQFGPSAVVSATDTMVCQPSKKVRYRPQPYIVYEVGTDPQPQAVVDLDDQFITELGVPVEDRQYLMNPVDKIPVNPLGREELITDPDLHYRWFPLPLAPTGNRLVKVSNQFATLQLWRIEDMPEFLLAPASKSPDQPGPVPTGHHYNCYRVVNAPPAGAIVDLNDQFAGRPAVPVTDARYLCAPVEKTKGGEVFKTLNALHRKDHLACYDIPELPLSVSVNTEDQFGVSAVLNELDEMLCVPTRKTHGAHGVPSLAPWGMVALGLSMLLLVFWVAGRRMRSEETA